MHYLMFYDFVPDCLERRLPYRAEPLRYAWEARARGKLIPGGPLGDPAGQGALLFYCESDETPRQFAEADLYVKRGVITGNRVLPWTTVVGEDAVAPLLRCGSLRGCIKTRHKFHSHRLYAGLDRASYLAGQTALAAPCPRPGRWAARACHGS